ncbi:MAG TPA: hypothetical protein VFB62_20630 [Polyangiaceae bacterium]|jgi:hypothetical protein|nr:hypothetical protein [Polyangiaceae bacterium]
MRSYFVAVVVGAALSTVAPTAFACSCMQPPPPAQALADASRVFEGEVKTVNQAEPGHVVATFRVLRAWKGVNEPEVVVHTAGDSAACGLGFAAGQRWLLYAHLHENNTHANLCSRSTQESAGDIAALGPPSFTPASDAPIPPPSQPPPSAPSPTPAPPPAEQPSGGCAGCTVSSRAEASWWMLALALTSGAFARLRRERLQRREPLS